MKIQVKMCRLLKRNLLITSMKFSFTQSTEQTSNPWMCTSPALESPACSPLLVVSGVLNLLRSCKRREGKVGRTGYLPVNFKEANRMSKLATTYITKDLPNLQYPHKNQKEMQQKRKNHGATFRLSEQKTFLSRSVFLVVEDNLTR